MRTGWLYVDGGYRDLPTIQGAMSAGVVLCLESTDLASVQRSVYLGPAGTNNQAEYLAVLVGLQVAFEHGVSEVIVHSDSQLIVRQLNHEYRVNDETLEVLKNTVLWFCRMFTKVEFRWIPRGSNAMADALASAGLP